MSLPNNTKPPELTERERKILRLIAKGQSNKEIGRTLNITKGTVEWYVHNILRKLGETSRAQAVAQAIGLGYINPGETS